MVNKICGIYMIENLINKKCYIGSSKNISGRIGKHLSLLAHGKHQNSYLQNAVIKYGIDNFKVSILEICKEVELITKEQYYIDSSNSEYNITRMVERNILSKSSRMLISNTLKDGFNSGRIKRTNKSVRKYSLNGEFICEYESLKSATIDVKIHTSTLIRCLKKKYGTAGGFAWRYSSEPFCSSIGYTRRRIERPMRVIDIITGEVLFFRSCKECAVFLDTYTGMLQRYIDRNYIFRKKYRVERLDSLPVPVKSDKLLETP